MAGTTVNWKDESEGIHEVLYRFEKAFAEGKNPQINDYLEGDGTSRWRLLLELLHSDLELRLRAGQSVKVADYLVRYPELAKFPNEVIVLLETEIRLLKQMGKQLAPQTYEQQFGSVLGDRVKELFSRVRGSLPVIPGYEILDTIGHGGMGVVYRARHLLLNREVALKLIRPEKMRDEASTASFKARFRREAESVASINHPNVVQIYETGDYDGTLFLAMELVKGQSLQKHIDTNGVMSPHAAAVMFIKIAIGLQAVHDKQIIHRDLKPENILLNEQLEPKISDFGLARPLEGASHETAAGTPVGTPAYMSPEQASLKDEKITPLVDVYGLGATLYCALTGHAPFPRESPLVTLEKVRTEDVLPIRDQRKEVPLDLETICLKCLSKEPGKRYSDANVLAEELRRFANNEPIHARPVGRVEKTWLWCKRHPMVAGLTAGIAALLIAATFVSSGLSWWALNEKERADGNATVAKARAEEAKQNAKEVQQEKQRVERLLVMQANREGIKAMESGDQFMSLLWFTQPFVLAREQPEVEHMARERLGANRSFANNHFVVSQIVAHQGEVYHAVFSPDGRLVVTASADKTACVWDARTGLLVVPPLQHMDTVYRAVFSSDGCRVVTACADKTARVWDVRTGLMAIPPLQHLDSVYHAAFSPDGRQIVTASADKTARVWDASSGQPLTPPLQHQDIVLHASFSPNGQRVVTGSWDKSARVWDTITGQPITPSLLQQSGVRVVTFSPDGQRVLISSNESVREWDAVTGQAVTPPLLHQERVEYASFSPDGQLVVTASEDKTARVWNAKTGVALSPSLQHQDRVYFAEFSPDGRIVVTASKDNSARLWNARTGQPISPPLVHEYSVTHVTFSPDCRRILTSSLDKTAKVWEADTGKLSSHILEHQNAVTHATYSLDGQRVVTTSFDKTAQVWEASSGKKVTLPLKHQNVVNYATFSLDGRRVVTASSDRTARVWDISTSKAVMLPLLHRGTVSHATFSPDGHRILTTSGNMAQVWDAATGKKLLELLQHHGEVRHATFSPDGRRVVTASDDKTAQVWDASKGKVVTPPLVHQDRVTHSAFSPDGRRVITASYDKTARVWDASTGQPVTLPLLHNEAVGQATFSADGSRVVTASGDKTARVWDASTGQAVTPPLLHQGSVTYATFSLDARRVVTASEDMTARVWDTNTGQLLTQPLHHKSDVRHAAFSPDGRRVLTASFDGTARIWDLPLETRPIADLLKLAQVYASHKIDETGGLQPLDVEKELIPWYQEMKAKYPDEFIPRYEDTRRWRLQQIADCCKENNLTAALFHQNWLLAEAVLEAAKSNAK